MKNNDDIPYTDADEIKQFINRVKRGTFRQASNLALRLSKSDGIADFIKSFRKKDM